MRKQMKFLALIIIIVGVSQNVFSQRLLIGGKEFTNSEFFVKAGTEPEIEVVAYLGSATNTQWLSDTDKIIPIDPEVAFPFIGEDYKHKAKFRITSPGGNLYVRFLFDNGEILNTSITFVYTIFPEVISEDKPVSACQNSVEIFHATETTNTEYVYNWQYRTNNSANWLTASDGIGNNMPIQFSENQGYEYRCIVSLSSCEACRDTTGIITVSEIYPLPNFTISDDMSEVICPDQSVVTYTVTVIGGTPSYTVSLVESSHPYLLVGENKLSEGVFEFSVMLKNPPVPGEQVTGFTTEYIVVDRNGCYGQ